MGKLLVTCCFAQFLQLLEYSEHMICDSESPVTMAVIAHFSHPVYGTNTHFWIKEQSAIQHIYGKGDPFKDDNMKQIKHH